MPGETGIWTLAPRERLPLLAVLATLWIVVAGSCVRRRRGQPDMVPPPEGAAAIATPADRGEEP